MPVAHARRRRHPGEVLAVDAHGARDRLEQPGDRPQRRRLAGAVGPDQRHDLAGADRQRQVAHHRRRRRIRAEAVESRASWRSSAPGPQPTHARACSSCLRRRPSNAVTRGASGPSAAVATAIRAGVAPELARRAAVGRAEQAAEVRRAGQPPAARDRRDRLVGERRIEQVAAAAIKPRGADEVAHAEPFALEHPVQVARRDEARTGDLLGVQARIAQVARRCRPGRGAAARPSTAAARTAATRRDRRTAGAPGRSRARPARCRRARCCRRRARSAAPQKNRAASRGRPGRPGSVTAVRRETLPACLPSVAFGSLQDEQVERLRRRGRSPAARCHSRSCRRASAPRSRCCCAPSSWPRSSEREVQALGVAGGDVRRRAAHRVGPAAIR